MNLGEILPRFQLKTKLSETEVFERMTAYIEKDSSVLGKVVHNLYYLDIPHVERHFWSPELRVAVEQDELTEAREFTIRVQVGPQYTVWVMFIFIYSFLTVLALFSGFYGLAQLNLGYSTLWVWCFPFFAFLIMGVYVIAKSGQRKGRNQTLHLVSCLYHGLGTENIERVDSY